MEETACAKAQRLEQALHIWEQKVGSFDWSDLDEGLEIGSISKGRKRYQKVL